MKLFKSTLSLCLLLAFCIILSGCGKEYNGNYQCTKDHGENSAHSLNVSGGSFKMTLQSGDTETVIKGTVEELGDNKLSFIHQKQTDVDESGNKAKKDFDDATESVYTYQDGTLTSEDGKIVFVRQDKE